MSWWEILIIIAAAAFVAGVAVWSFVKRKKGKGGCADCCGNCCGCAGCSHPEKK